MRFLVFSLKLTFSVEKCNGSLLVTFQIDQVQLMERLIWQIHIDVKYVAIGNVDKCRLIECCK